MQSTVWCGRHPSPCHSKASRVSRYKFDGRFTTKQVESTPLDLFNTQARMNLIKRPLNWGYISSTFTCANFKKKSFSVLCSWCFIIYSKNPKDKLVSCSNKRGRFSKQNCLHCPKKQELFTSFFTVWKTS